MTENPAFVEAASNTDRFYTVIKSMNEFDKAEVKGVIDTVLSPTPRCEHFALKKDCSLCVTAWAISDDLWSALQSTRACLEGSREVQSGFPIHSEVEGRTLSVERVLDGFIG